tara:strand:- start:783 stop:1832 length:1050 start_codon:yes stop_codon:yes gene_type:complete
MIYKTSSGREAILLALKSIALNNKKYVITQAFTCSAVPEAIISAGYEPFWVDIEMHTFSLDINLIIDLLKNNSSIFSAIIIQHTFGVKPEHYEELIDISRSYSIPIIEDRCHCNFVFDYSELLTSSFNREIAFCYSFENGKPIKLGRGGLLIVDNQPVEIIKSLDAIYFRANNVSLFSSFFHFLISFAYTIFEGTIFYWPLLRTYRRFSKVGIFPANFNKTLNQLKINRIGFIQSLFVHFLIKITNIKYINRSLTSKILGIIFSPLFNYFIKNRRKYPLFVKNKKFALKYCESQSITVLDFFNTPIQPLVDKDYQLAFYKAGLCPNAEKASRHIISFTNPPSPSFLNNF